jgi:alcohol dehydrogenase
MADYWDRDNASRPLAPLVAAPTTAGTGSEVQSFALISDAATHRKMACGDRSAAPRVALLDPDLTRSMPPFVAACTGIDTLTHAVESAVTRARTERSTHYARAAFELVYRALPASLSDPSNESARAAMLRAAALAGLAIEHSMLGAAHSLANPLTASFGVPHGQAVGNVLPAVVRFNAEVPAAREEYELLARSVGLNGDASVLADALQARVDQAGLAKALLEHGVQAEHLAGLAADAATQWTAGFNPRPVGPAELESMLRAALG